LEWFQNNTWQALAKLVDPPVETGCILVTFLIKTTWGKAVSSSSFCLFYRRVYWLIEQRMGRTFQQGGSIFGSTNQSQLVNMQIDCK
jgi:hypothetical protein